ncbi:MAG: hypothetical protein KDA32_08300 [Phycisphaerales bacterium]|nr:hypothetical protein [Phycisphaerales bacterium]
MNAIEFHCEHCGKHIRAPHSAGGTHGKCPSCHQDVYIPTPDDELAPMDLAPMDESEERRVSRLIEEERQLTHELLHERDVKRPGDKTPPKPPTRPASEEPLLSDHDLEHLAGEYVAKMAAGRLAEAEKLAATIRRHGARAKPIVEHLMADELPPVGAESVPRPVILGFLKQLLG